MCPGISYSTVHSLIFHTNGSVQNNKLFTEFCNRKQAHFLYSVALGAGRITDEMIDNETLTLMDQPQEEKYDGSMTAITGEYEVITTFMKIHNIFATWEPFPYSSIEHLEVPSKTSYQLKVGSYHPSSDNGYGRGPPM